MTERETEALLVRQTRDLALPCGRKEVVTHSAHVWQLFDLIQESGFYTHDELMQLSRDNMAGTGYSFTDAFVSVVTYIHRTMVEVAKG